MNKKILILPAVIAGLGLASCSNQTETDQTIKITASKGTAAVALAGKISIGYTKTTSSYEKAAFELNGKSDVVITDAATGLHKLVREKSDSYGVSKLVSKSSDLLFSVTGGSEITSESIVLSYAKGSSTDLAFKKLCEDFWHVEPTIKYVESAKDLLKAFETGKIDEQNFNFTICPMSVGYELDVNESKYAIASSYGVISDLNTYWANYTNAIEGTEKQDFIPGLISFVSKDSAKNKSKGIEDFNADLKIGVKNAIDTPENLASIMDSYSLNETQQMEMFNATSTITKKAKEDESINIYNFVRDDETVDTNNYLESFMKLVDTEITDYTNCYFQE